MNRKHCETRALLEREKSAVPRRGASVERQGEHRKTGKIGVQLWTGSLAVTALFTSIAVSGGPHAQPAGFSCEEVAPLYRWYSASRGDNFTTADPLWRGPIGAQRSGEVLRLLGIRGGVHPLGG